MTWLSWLVPAVLAFLGALVGGAIAAGIALRGQHQDARVEWRARLDRAIDLTASDSRTQQQIGDVLLTDLVNSDLGSPADRDLARRVAQIRVTAELDQDDSMDQPGQIEHNGSEDEQEGPT